MSWTESACGLTRATPQDLHTIDLEDYKFAKTKITSFKLVDSTNPELHSLLADWSLLASKRGLHNVRPPEHILVSNVSLSLLTNDSNERHPRVRRQTDTEWREESLIVENTNNSDFVVHFTTHKTIKFNQISFLPSLRPSIDRTLDSTHTARHES